MKQIKYLIGFLLFFIFVGLAAVTTNLIISGEAVVKSNPDDFLVYFSDVTVNGVEDLSLVESETVLKFTGEFSALGDKKIISYDITNASKNYDADIAISCTNSTDYLTITNVFDSTKYLEARSTRNGSLTIELSKAVSNELSQNITCTINATAVSRNELNTNDVDSALENPFRVGKEVLIGDQRFNIISSNDTHVHLLARYNIGIDYKQSSVENAVVFSNSNGWEYTPGPKDIEVSNYDGDAKTYIDRYVSYLKQNYSISSIEGTLITNKELKSLGCTISNNYSWVTGTTCEGSEHFHWLAIGEYWWTRSASSDNAYAVWYVNADGRLSTNNHATAYAGIRPVIIVPKEYFDN